MTRTIAEFQKNARETVRVDLTNYKGYDLVDFRSWVETPDGERKPTRTGITVRVALLPNLEAAIKKAAAEARAAGLLD